MPVTGALRARIVEYTAIAVLFAAISGFSYATQHATVASRWDGARYQQMAEQLAHGAPARTEAPFVYRIGWPWLVAKLFPFDVLRGFTILNVMASAAACGLFALWLEAAGVGSMRARVLLVALFMAAWHGPARFLYFAPTLVDPPLFAGLLAGSLLVKALRRGYRRRSRW
jgi:hypothetical protein